MDVLDRLRGLLRRRINARIREAVDLAMDPESRDATSAQLIAAHVEEATPPPPRFHPRLFSSVIGLLVLGVAIGLAAMLVLLLATVVVVVVFTDIALVDALLTWLRE